MKINDKQMHIGMSEGDVGRYVILTGDPGRSQSIAEKLDNPTYVATNREYVTYTGYLLGEKVSVCSTGMGGPSTAIGIEELIKIGADTFIRVGTCGGINHKVLGGDVIVASAAIRQEGTTLEYMPIEFPAAADFDVTVALKKACDNLGLVSHVGTVQSKDNFYGQHSPDSMPVGDVLKYKWSAWKAGGTLGSEMECASVFVVSAVRNARAGAVLNVLWNQEREKNGLSNPKVMTTENGINAAIEAIKILIEQDKK